VEEFRFHPAVKRKSGAEVSVVLFRHWEGTRRELRFKQCGNLEVVVDADVLLGNAPNNSAVLQATADAEEIRRIVKKGRRNWNVRYEKSIDPLPQKLQLAERSVLFRVQLFGGVLQVVARSFAIKRLTPPSSGRL
jgi:hypothetical protein